MYIALFTFFIPFVLSLGDEIASIAKGGLFVFLGFIGILFCLIVVRYRIYKEVYWLCCQTISQLKNYDPEQIDKLLVQKLFYNSMLKKFKSQVDFEKKKIKNFKFFKGNLFSSETLHFLILAFVTSLVVGLGVTFMINLSSVLTICIGVLSGFGVLFFLISNYFNNVTKVFKCLADDKDSSFNFSFSKAWFLHFYQ